MTPIAEDIPDSPTAPCRRAVAVIPRFVQKMFCKQYDIPNNCVNFAVETLNHTDKMTISRQIEARIEQLQPAFVFSIADLGLPGEWWECIRVKLGRMIKKGVIEKISRGKYYKPQKTVFGNIGPDLSEMIKDLLYQGNERAGYITGYSIWQKMGLTSQISSTIVIGTNRRHDPMTRGMYQIRFVMQPNTITSANVGLLQILDAIKYIKNIPDTSIEHSIIRLKNIISELNIDEYREMVELSMKYPPRVRALLGAMLQDIGKSEYETSLRSSLNPTTVYNIGLSSELLSSKNNWNIE